MQDWQTNEHRKYVSLSVNVAQEAKDFTGNISRVKTYYNVN
jgi:hypothetical protein